MCPGFEKYFSFYILHILYRKYIVPVLIYYKTAKCRLLSQNKFYEMKIIIDAVLTASELTIK